MTSTPEELRQEVIQARERLGDTVERLAARADVKSRARVRAAEIKEEVREQAGQATERLGGPPLAAVAGGVALLLVLMVIRGKRAEKGEG
ncbi:MULTISPECIES: DUF3618 domain-containing protein [Streptomyces]|uniref:DUF3618 domain-containing protein n=1 Tax=Streptomyces xinghaiensis TaxID=1038928 RepID=A0A420UUZ4_9ACTN|nr:MULTISPECIES: DUF3618 domain-containing protein [Streptomyces]OFA52414.1 hypothetical protein BEN35_11460 [Streptomyces fradiae]PQM21096.1 DUF3618 domain-containing protein [Streptomyces xinghaiensis]RKM91071.1 DUF3618 domain-containing protein [Streptomyces xinghaiensis]RNC72537.1 DUF3618 domain-containing protein [Streptomyces xinghaiensis]